MGQLFFFGEGLLSGGGGGRGRVACGNGDSFVLGLEGGVGEIMMRLVLCLGWSCWVGDGLWVGDVSRGWVRGGLSGGVCLGWGICRGGVGERGVWVRF